jgi:hypothetical protein
MCGRLKMDSPGWIHDLILFLTALCAAYAAWKGQQNSKGIEVVKSQTNGLIEAAAVVSRQAGHSEGIREGIALAQQLPPPGPPK